MSIFKLKKKVEEVKPAYEVKPINPSTMDNLRRPLLDEETQKYIDKLSLNNMPNMPMPQDIPIPQQIQHQQTSQPQMQPSQQPIRLVAPTPPKQEPQEQVIGVDTIALNVINLIDSSSSTAAERNYFIDMFLSEFFKALGLTQLQKIRLLEGLKFM
jgi:hypothetical protein